MIEREPFAKWEIADENQNLYWVILNGERTGRLIGCEPDQTEFDKLNSAHEQAVRERVREAVEAFRERAAKAVMQTGSGLLASAYAAAIRALPVEEKR